MNESSLETSPDRERRFRKRWIAFAFLAAWVSVGAWGTLKPMPPGTNVATAPVELRQSEVDFLYDLTSADGYGRPVHEQSIFDRVFEIIDGAETFVITDFFLLNDMMGATNDSHRALSREFADRLIARKRAKPELSVLLITDPINEIYGGAPSPVLQELKSAGIDVVLTDLESMRDSNPGYSALWRMFASWWGNAPTGGRMPNPFTTDSPGITLRSWLALLNFKANHRKLIVADRRSGRLTALVTSANPHDASSAHSNVALQLSGPLAGEIAASEMAIARFSGWRGHIYTSSVPTFAPRSGEQTVEVAFLTEAAIGKHLLNAIGTTRNGDAIRIAMFYLSDRKMFEALLAAARRGVIVRLILDPNRDAFGRHKDGVPNRPVANELVSESEGGIQVRWYRTHGEQFHTKLVLITQSDRLIASLGSANLTRRNLWNYNLEANVALEMAADSPLASKMVGFFDKLWSNEAPPGTQFTAAFGAYQDDSRGRYWRYRVMEATGLSTF